MSDVNIQTKKLARQISKEIIYTLLSRSEGMESILETTKELKEKNGYHDYALYSELLIKEGEKMREIASETAQWHKDKHTQDYNRIREQDNYIHTLKKLLAENNIEFPSIQDVSDVI